MEKIKTALVGTGKVGHLHAAALQAIPESQFVAVCSRNLERAKAFAQKYGVKAYADVREMIADAHVQAVIIGTPHPNHAEPAIQAAQAGAHVLVEKPLAASLGDCDRMLQAARASNVKLGTISQRRFYAPCQRVRQAIDEGKIGRPILGTVAMYGWRDQAYYASDPWRGQWAAEGGGVLVNQAPHQLDLLHWYMGEIDELTGYWGNLNHPYIEVEDTAVAVLRFKNGALGNIVVSNSQNPALYGKVHVHGSNGASIGVQTDGGAMFIAGMSNITEPPINDLWTVPGEEPLLKTWQDEDAAFFRSINPTESYHRLQIRDFLQAILHNRQPAVTGEDGRRTVEIFTAIYRSQRDHKPVKFPLKAEATSDLDGRLVR
ncbi:MAG TPA: Gfo/Idh/MocA family oxidoreductase [Tepidisphaeraceae bacterium]|nr:Gfo/Idh/MocA family oxidoreductase [Tepidisphaeraceae bacterium]